jgi:hypothetical protein
MTAPKPGIPNTNQRWKGAKYRGGNPWFCAAAFACEVVHFDLHEDHRHPEQPGHRIEPKRSQQPALADRRRRQHHQQSAGDRLQQHRRQREQHVGNHHGLGRARDVGNVAAAMRHQHEERDAGPGAENDDGAEHMQILDQEIQRYRLLALRADRGFKAPASSGPASFTPPSVSANQ